jgi:hypothetical protein
MSAEGRWDQSLGILDHILQLSPNNGYALARPLVEDRYSPQAAALSRYV